MYALDEPVDYARMTHAELYAAAVGAGITFRLITHTLKLDAGDRVQQMLEVGNVQLNITSCAIGAELDRRRQDFARWVRAKLEKGG